MLQPLGLSRGAILVVALVVGASAPPLTVLVRTLWRMRLPDPALRQTAFALDAVVLELAYTIGPALIALAVAVGPPGAPLALALAFTAIAVPLMFASGALAWWTRSEPGERHLLGPLRDTRLLVLFAATFTLTMAFGGIEVGYPDFGRASGADAWGPALIACWWAGLVAVPVNAKLHPKELAWVLDDCGARWAFVDEGWHAMIGGLRLPALERAVVLGGREHEALAGSATADPAPVASDAPAWLFYTSGTTGRPKGVEITHANLVAMTQCFLSDVEGIAPGDAILHPAPLSHGSGLYAVPHVARAAVNVVPASGGFDPAEIADLVGAWDRALFFAAPTMVKRLVEDAAIGRANLGRLKSVVYGGGPMYVEDAKAAFAALGPRLAQIYGQGESPMTITAMGRELVADAIARGRLNRAIRARHVASRSASDGASSRGTTNATTDSPHSGSGRPTTATACTPGWVISASSTSRG